MPSKTETFTNSAKSPYSHVDESEGTIVSPSSPCESGATKNVNPGKSAQDDPVKKLRCGTPTPEKGFLGSRKRKFSVGRIR